MLSARRMALVSDDLPGEIDEVKTIFLRLTADAG
jgi:hypothetical protein